MKKNMKKNTLDGFLKIKALKDKITEKAIIYKIPTAEGEEEQVLEIKRMSEKRMYEIISEITEVYPDITEIEMADQVLYMAIPELQKAEIQEHFGCKDDPEEIVRVIFSAADRLAIFKKLREVLNTTTIEEIKNL